MKKRLFLIFIISLMADLSWAGTYYVSSTGGTNWANATNRSTPCNIVTANTNAIAGDTVIVIDNFSTLSSHFVTPTNNGSSGNWITFQGETSSITVSLGQYKAIRFGSASTREYIKIKDFNFVYTGAVSNYGEWGEIGIWGEGNIARHIVVENCNFTVDPSITSRPWSGFYINGRWSDLTFKNCTFIGQTPGSAYGIDDIFYVLGYAESGNPQSRLLFDGCTFYSGMHAAIDIQDNGTTFDGIVLRNCTFENPNHTSLNIYGSAGGVNQHVLLENSVIKNSGTICSLTNCNENQGGSVNDKAATRAGHSGFQSIPSYSINRYNTYYKNGIGLDMGPPRSTTQGNRIYNNAFYKNCVGISIPNWGYDVTNNTFLNNILKDNNEPANQTNYPIYFSLQSSANYAVEFGYNYADEANNSYYRDPTQTKTGTLVALNADPDGTIFHNNAIGSVLFVNPTGYDFHLQFGSPARDAGSKLTTVHATDTGSGTSLIVVDARFFQDGSWGPTTSGYTVNADYIAVGTVTNTVQISSINYATNTITLANGITRSNGQSVWLYKKSDGVIVLYGSAPDCGAYEYAGGTHSITIGAGSHSITIGGGSHSITW